MRIACYFLLLTALPLAAQTDQYEGFAGFWLKKRPRRGFCHRRALSHGSSPFASKAAKTPLHVSREYEYIGVRSWFFEPTQIAESGLPAPATGHR